MSLINSMIYKAFSGKGRMKPQVVVIGFLSFLALFAIFLIAAQRDAARRQTPAAPFLTQKAPPTKALDYKIIEIDTIPYGQITLPRQQRKASRPAAPARVQAAQPPRVRKPAVQKPSRVPVRRRSSQSSTATGTGGDMIVLNKLGQASASAASPYAGSGFSGLQSVRLKVILPQKTPVTNGSLVEARVIKAAKFGNLEIPRRARLLGLTRLQNNRIQIDFREIRINGRTYSCSGRAFDLKFLPGIQYNPLPARARQVLLEELKSSASGVPVLGRLINRPDFNPVTDEITALDEGQEFYALITSIF